MKISQWKRVARNIQLNTVKNDTVNRFAPKVIPNKKKVVRKFDFRRELA